MAFYYHVQKCWYSKNVAQTVFLLRWILMFFRRQKQTTFIFKSVAQSRKISTFLQMVILTQKFFWLESHYALTEYCYFLDCMEKKVKLKLVAVFINYKKKWLAVMYFYKSVNAFCIIHQYLRLVFTFFLFQIDTFAQEHTLTPEKFFQETTCNWKLGYYPGFSFTMNHMSGVGFGIFYLVSTWILVKLVKNGYVPTVSKKQFGFKVFTFVYNVTNDKSYYKLSSYFEKVENKFPHSQLKSHIF